MIAFIEGKLEEKSPEAVVINAGGIGYEVKVPLNVLEQLPNIGETLRLHTYMQIREDSTGLFGFLSKVELDFFKLLIGVNSVGPKAALSILSTLSVQDLRFAIMAGDAKAIAKAPNIGGKTASKVILELKDKVQQMAVDNIQSMSYDAGDTNTGKNGGQNSRSSVIASVRKDTVEALIALGYGATQAHQAVAKIPIDEGTEVEMALKMALKYIY